MAGILLIAHDIRSTHNVGSLFRTAEGLGVDKLWLSGYSPYPLSMPDARLPHLARRAEAQIAKTALGSEKTLAWEHAPDIAKLIHDLKTGGFTIAALEQAPGARPLPSYQAPAKVAVIVGNEVAGVAPEILQMCDDIIEIPMSGRKESFNVGQAAAMCLYHIRFISRNL